jgi:hypothetical protein
MDLLRKKETNEWSSAKKIYRQNKKEPWLVDVIQRSSYSADLLYPASKSHWNDVHPKADGMRLLSGALQHLTDRLVNRPFDDGTIDTMTILMVLQRSLWAEADKTRPRIAIMEDLSRQTHPAPEDSHDNPDRLY